MRFVNGTAWGLMVQIIFAASLFIFWIAGEKIQQTYFPVIKSVEIVAIGLDDDGRLLVVPKVNKARDCDWVNTSWWVTDKNGDSSQVAIDYPEMIDGEQSAPAGITIQDIHRISQNTFADVESQFGVIKHNCFGIFTLRYVIGPMPIITKEKLYDPSFLARLNRETSPQTNPVE